MAWRRLLLQGEAYKIMLNRSVEGSASDISFSGYYFQFGYTLVGRPRRWVSRTGAFSSPMCDRPGFRFCEGFGVLEAGARYSEADLRSGGIEGGRQRAWSGVLNWWPTDIIKIAFQYEYARLEGLSSAGHFHALLGLFQLKF